MSKDFQRCNALANRQADWHAAVRCLGDEQLRLDKRLSALLQQKSAHTRSETQKSLLQQSQAHWQSHRDAECQALRGPDTGDASDVVLECSVLKTARRLIEVERAQR